MTKPAGCNLHGKDVLGSISIYMKEYEYQCEHCKKKFATYYKKRGKRIFCSNKCQAEVTRSKIFSLICTQCKKEIKHANWNRRQRKKVFCSRQCYWNYKKETGYGANLKSLKNARKNSNSAHAIQKRRNTNFQKGDWTPDDFIVDGITYKQYRGKVYRLTRNLKSDLIKKWDGVDYYDGEYIKDNLKLYKQHGDYPSIDHIIGVQEGFKRGISPVELCKEENLVWTKRRINSSKRQYKKPILK